ncbi:MAG TPA: ATP-binding protein [Polyangia bacterium]
MPPSSAAPTSSSSSSRVGTNAAAPWSPPTNSSPSGGVFGDEILAAAILDCLLHHSRALLLEGDSDRLKQKCKAGLVPKVAKQPAAPRGSVLVSFRGQFACRLTYEPRRRAQPTPPCAVPPPCSVPPGAPLLERTPGALANARATRWPLRRAVTSTAGPCEGRPG